MGDDQVKTQSDKVIAGAMPETDAMDDNQAETPGEEVDVMVKGDEEVNTPGEGATAGALAETDAVTNNQVKVQVEEMNVIVKEVEELKVTNKETAGTTMWSGILKIPLPRLLMKTLI